MVLNVFPLLSKIFSVNYTLLSVAVWFVFIAHLSTFGGLFLAVYPKYVEKYRTRKCLFILRLIDCLVMAAAFTVAVALCTAAVPDQWRMGFAFICAWVAMAVMWAIVFLSAVQVGKKFYDQISPPKRYPNTKIYSRVDLSCKSYYVSIYGTSCHTKCSCHDSNFFIYDTEAKPCFANTCKSNF